MRVALISLGCKVNQAEFAEIEKEIVQNGHKRVDIGDSPDICIINTCTVTQKSDYQSRQIIRKALKSKSKVYVTGCYSELNKEKVSSIGDVEFIENNKKNKIATIIGFDLSKKTDAYEHRRSRFFLKVQDGCDFKCTYCIVSKARGSSKSLSSKEVVDKVNEAVSYGYKEVVLSGIHLGLYGKEHFQKMDIAGLVKLILKNTKLQRLRLSSLEVGEISDEIIETLMDSRVCRHLHIPLQSGDNEVLSAMGRRYATCEYESKINRISGLISGISIGTDIIAGFPTETDEQFSNTMDFINNLPLSYLHVFPYSSRPGTAASEMSDIVGSAKRTQRAMDLRALSALKKSNFIKSNIGQTLSVLAEQRVNDDEWTGTSDNYLKISFKSNNDIYGTITNVKVLRYEDGLVIGNVDIST